MKHRRHHDLTVEERARLGQLLAGLGPQDWERPSACDGWTVRDVVAHLVAWDDLLLHTGRLGHPAALARWAAAMGRARFDPHRFNAAAVARDEAPDVLLARFEAGSKREQRWLFERVAPGAQLAEYLVHRLDIARALGLPAPVPEETLLLAVEGVARIPGVDTARREPKLRAPSVDVILELAGRST